MRYFLVLFVLLFQGQFSIKAFSLSDVDYTTADSVQVVQWLEEAREQYVKTDRMLFFAKKFLGRPYVGGVLDRNDNEKLVVNSSTPGRMWNVLVRVSPSLKSSFSW